MKGLYLASSITHTGVKIGEDIEKDTSKKAKDLKLAFIDTASEVSIEEDKTWLQDNREGLVKAGFEVVNYTVTGKSFTDLERDLKDFDVIHVNGGNPFYLLLQVKRSGFDKWIRQQISGNKKIYIGSSSGALILAPNMDILSLPDTQIYEKELKTNKGLGIVDFIIFPHWGSERFFERYFNARLPLAYKPENKIILLNNNQYIKVEGDTYKIVDVRDNETYD